LAKINPLIAVATVRRFINVALPTMANILLFLAPQFFCGMIKKYNKNR
jgi:hypothetical protein